MKKWMVVITVVVAAATGLGAITGAQAQGPRGSGETRSYAWLWSTLVDVVGDATGLTDAAVRQELRNGTSLAAICAANGCDLAAVRADVTAEAESAIAYAVENGRMTQDEADELRAELPALIDAALEITTPMRDLRSSELLEARSVAELAQTLWLMGDFTWADLQDAIGQDLTLAALAEQTGLDEADVVEQALAHLENHLQVLADHERITQDEMDAALAAAAESYPELMQQPLSELKPEARSRIATLRGRLTERAGRRDRRMGRFN